MFSLKLIITVFVCIIPISALDCEGGKYVATNDAGNEVCLSCPEDTYKTGTNDITECTQCPDATPRNHQTGSSDPSDCRYAACGQGQQYNQSNFLECIDCGVGTYQDKTYPLDFDECLSCPAGMSTASIQSTSSDCVKSCPSGQEYIPALDICEPCAINKYKDTSAVANGEYTSCVPCPDSAFRTETTGATSASDCNIVACAAGSYTDVATNQCVPCGVDEFQNEAWQTSCNPCPVDHGTLEGVTGADDIERCYRYCPDGEELVEEICVECAIGYYKDNGDGRFGNCVRCPDPAFITADTGSVHVDNCSIANCSSGSFLNTADNTCVLCPNGQYQPDAWQTSCISCPDGQTTEITGAESQADCKATNEQSFLVDIKTTIVCSVNPDLKDETSALYESLSARATTIVRNIIDANLTSVFVPSVDANTAQLIGFRCFDDTLSILLQVTVETTEMDSTIVESALQDVLTANMADGSLNDPLDSATAAISVESNGITADDIALSTDLSCSNGFYTDLPTLQCTQCTKGTYQPESVPELCFPCGFGYTTAGSGAIGNEANLCTILNPDDYITYTFQLGIETTIECNELYTDPTTNTYQSLYRNAEVIVRNVIIEGVDEQYRLENPVVEFSGYRCNSPVVILLRLQMTSLETTNINTANAVLAALNAEMADGVLSDPLGGAEGFGVEPSGATLGTILYENCPSGQQTNLENGQCVDCPQGTYNPEAAVEMCYECPVGTTTEGTGIVLPTGDNPETVCIIAVTDPPIDFTFSNLDPNCPGFYYLDGACVTNCPSGYTADDSRVCMENEDDESGSDEKKKRKRVTDTGIAVAVGLGCVLFAMLVILVLCCFMHKCRERPGDVKRFLDIEEDDRSSYRSRSSPPDYSRGSYRTAVRPSAPFEFARPETPYDMRPPLPPSAYERDRSRAYVVEGPGPSERRDRRRDVYDRKRAAAYDRERPGPSEREIQRRYESEQPRALPRNGNWSTNNIGVRAYSPYYYYR